MSGEILYLRREMTYIRHQNECIMRALQINACECQDCNGLIPIFANRKQLEDSTAGFPKPCETKTKLNIWDQSSSAQAAEIKKELSPIRPNGSIGGQVNLFDDVLFVNHVKKAKQITESTLIDNENLVEKSPNCVQQNVPVVPNSSLPNVSGTSTPSGKSLWEVKTELAAAMGTDSPSFHSPGARYTPEQKEKMLGMYQEKGARETAKILNISRMALSGVLRRYRKTKAIEKGNVVKSEVGLKRKPIAKLQLKRKRAAGKRIIRRVEVTKRNEMISKLRNRDMLAKMRQSNIIKSSLGNKKKRLFPAKRHLRKRSPKRVIKQEIVEESKEDSIFARRKHSKWSHDEKKAIYYYYLDHGDQETMKHFDLSYYSVYYISKNIATKKFRDEADTERCKWKAVNVDSADNNLDLDTSNITGKNDENLAEENSLNDICHESVFSPVEVAKKRRSRFAKKESLEKKICSPVNSPIPDAAIDNEKASVKKQLFADVKSHKIVEKKRALTKLQEQQLHQVLSVLDKQGTAITKQLVAYTAKKIIKNSVTTQENFSVSPASVRSALKSYKAKPVNE